MEQIIEKKIKLFKELHIRITKDIKNKLYACRNEIQLDNVARSIILKEE